MKTAKPYPALPEMAVPGSKVAVLAVSPHREDHSCLQSIFSHSNWQISEARDCREARRLLRATPMAVVISECMMPDGSWRDMLKVVSQLSYKPLLVVASGDADDDLWAEVLNLGAYDVLSKPFDRAEVTRIVSLAWLQWKEQISRAPRKVSRQSDPAYVTGLSATA